MRTHPPHLLACMAEMSVWVDMVKFSQQDPAALRLTGSPSEAPTFSLVLSGLADGTFLPPLLFFCGSLPPLPHGFPENILLEDRPKGLGDPDLHSTWINTVGEPMGRDLEGAWLTCLASVGCKGGGAAGQTGASLKNLRPQAVVSPA